MKSLRFLDRRVGFSLGALSILFGTMAPAVVPAFASADSQITSRSIQMSTSAKSATGVSYNVTFTPNETGSQNMAIEFCNNTPLIGSACTAPTGMDLSAATVTTGTILGSGADVGANFVDFSATLASPTTITLGNVTNPDGTGLSNGTFYARIMVFDNATDAGAVDGSGSESTGTMLDDGGVALAVTDTIGVNAAVLESMTFCVFGDPNNNTSSANGTADDSGYLATLTTATNGPAANCDDSAHGSKSPSVQLGEVNSNVSALSTSTPSYAADWAQLSTNASSGAIVYLKTSNNCVGLFRAGESTNTDCQIPAAGGSLAAGTGGFGLSFGSAVSATGATGSIGINPAYGGGSYDMLNSGTTTGGTDPNGDGLTEDTTGTYGGYVFGSEGAPVANKDIPFALGASVGNDTPAGTYSANLSLVAVGKF